MTANASDRTAARVIAKPVIHLRFEGMMKPRLLDLFCGAGGAAMGYHRAGFEVVGVDIQPQPRYPFAFVQGDALEYAERHGHTFDTIHASPPCQHYSVCTPPAYKNNHPDMIDTVRSLLQCIGKPYVIEKVEGARKHLRNPIKLCGSMFDVAVWRHRYFEVPSVVWTLTPPCNHSFVPVVVSGSPRRNGDRTEPTTQVRRDAMDIQWMTRAELDDAIPPIYTEWIGRRMMEVFL